MFEKTDSRPRLWIDDVKHSPHSATVAAVLTGGTLNEGESLVAAPDVLSIRIETIRVNAVTKQQAVAGDSVELGVTGQNIEKLRQGQALIRPAEWELSSAAECQVKAAAALNNQELSEGCTVAFGPGAHFAKVRLIQNSLEAGEIGPALLQLAKPLPLLTKDRFVIEKQGIVIGGGEVSVASSSIATPRLNDQASAQELDESSELIDLTEEGIKKLRRDTSLEL